MRERWAWWVATAGGVGTVPWAPGTAGSVVGLAIAWWAWPMLGTPWSAALIVALFGLGVAAASRTEQVARRRDPSIVVVDEVVGMLVALWALPFQAGEAVAAFLCFRLFDIAKPFPIRRLEAQPGGWGIMLDDVVAGLYANAVVRIGRWALGLS